MRHALNGILAVLLLLVVSATWALVPVPNPTGYVTDLTNLIGPAEMARTQVLLGKYEVTTGRKLSVLMVPSTPDEELEAFGDRVLQAWKMDSQDKGGALLLWSADGYIVIRVAGPLGERLDGEAQSDILSRWVVPQFARGEAGTGIRQGVERMMAVLDGGDVGFPAPDAASNETPGADTAAEDSAASSEDVTAEAAPGNDTEAATEADSDRETRAEVLLESPMGMPPWVENLPEEFSRLLGKFSNGPFSGLAAWFGEAGDQVSQLSKIVPEILLQMRGELAEPAFHPVSIGAAYAFAGLLALAALLVWGRAFVAALVVAGLGGGVALWLATGLLALATVAMLAGLLAPVLVPILRALLRGANDSERDPMPTTFDPSRYAARPAPAYATRPATAMKNPGSARTGVASQRQVARNLVTTTAYSQSKRQQRGEELVDLIKAIARSRVRQLKPIHGVVALVLVFLALPLAILALLVVLTILAYRDGVAYLLVDLLVAEPGARERLKERLPRPKTEAA